MKQFARLLNLKLEGKKCFTLLSNEGRKGFLRGNIIGKNFDIFFTTSSKCQKRLVAQVILKTPNNVHFIATKKRLGYSLLKVLGKKIILSHDPILDRKIAFQSNDFKFAEYVFQYEEICEKFDALFSHKFTDGILELGTSSIFYYENIAFLNKNRRERFLIAINLICDLFDVLYFYNKQRA